MSTATVAYTPAGGAETRVEVDLEKHDIGKLLDACRRRIFPGEEPPERDAVFEGILAERKAAKPKPRRAQDEAVKESSTEVDEAGGVHGEATESG